MLFFLLLATVRISVKLPPNYTGASNTSKSLIRKSGSPRVENTTSQIYLSTPHAKG